MAAANGLYSIPEDEYARVMSAPATMRPRLLISRSLGTVPDGEGRSGAKLCHDKFMARRC